MANFFKKAGKALGKASKFVSSNAIVSAAVGAVPVVGGIAAKAAQFGAKLDSKGKSVSQASSPSLQAPSSVAASAPSRAMGNKVVDDTGVKGFFTKAWEFIKKNWLLVIVLPIGLIILFVIVKKLMGKKAPARRRSTAFLAKARAAKAAKRRR